MLVLWERVRVFPMGIKMQELEHITEKGSDLFAIRNLCGKRQRYFSVQESLDFKAVHRQKNGSSRDLYAR